jgi:epoxyqueuosine reductase QueG
LAHLADAVDQPGFDQVEISTTVHHGRQSQRPCAPRAGVGGISPLRAGLLHLDEVRR